MNDKGFEDAYGVLIEGLKHNDLDFVLFNFYFILRRMVIVLILVWLDEYPFFQCTTMTVLSTINFIYMFSSRPLISRSENRIEIFNEGTILVCCHLMTLFLNIAIPQDLQMTLGWIMIGVILVNILVNITVVGSQTIN